MCVWLYPEPSLLPCCALSLSTAPSTSEISPTLAMPTPPKPRLQSRPSSRAPTPKLQHTGRTYLNVARTFQLQRGWSGGRQLRLGFKPGHSFFVFLFSTLLFVFRRKSQFVSVFLSPLKYCIIPFEQRKNRPKAENIGKHLCLARTRLPCFVFTLFWWFLSTKGK